MSLCSLSGTGRVNYNDDVWTEILLCLPAKSLTRFKLVCKSWLSLISSHQFCYLHTLRHPKIEPSLLLHMRTSQFFYFHPILHGEKLIPYRFTFTDLKVLSSCNGLLLLQSDRDYYVYNPTTNKSRKIVLTDNDKYINVLGLNLAFDPLKSLHYKIVCVRATKSTYSSRTRCCLIEVYDSVSRTWNPCLEPFTASIHVKFCYGVHWKNAIHWKNYLSTHLYFDIDKHIIGNLPCAKVPWPEGGGGTASSCQLQESNDKLYHFIIISNRGDKSVAVLELQEDYSEWVLKYHDRIGRIPGAEFYYRRQ